MSAIEFKNVSFGYNTKRKVINQVSFQINAGEYVCIVGHNGCGKSTISKLITGLLFPQEGEILINGEKMDENSIRNFRKDIGIIFQNPDNQFIGLTVEDDLAFGMQNFKVPRHKISETIKLVSDAMGIEDFIDKAPQFLSGGIKQRVAIASTLALNSNIIIFDESTAMLDPFAKEDLKKLMKLLRDKYKKTIISITHDMEEVTLADKVIVMSAGKILKVQKPIDVFSDNEFLLDIKLDSPFSIKLGLELQNIVDKDAKLSFDLDEVIESIWKSE